jgi:acyl-coenzyme A thioesterase PaaI-like protein
MSIKGKAVMSHTDHFTKLENMMHSAPFVKFTGARVKISKGEAKITLTVREDFYHAAGAMHGALYFLALDNAAFFAVNSLVEDVFVLTTSFTTYLTRPVKEGVLKARRSPAPTASSFEAKSPYPRRSATNSLIDGFQPGIFTVLNNFTCTRDPGAITFLSIHRPCSQCGGRRHARQIDQRCRALGPGAESRRLDRRRYLGGERHPAV